MRNTDRMAEYSRLDVPLVIDVNPAHELDQLTGLRALMRPFGVNCLTDQMKSHGIISHLRCALIPLSTSIRKNYHASEMRDNAGGHRRSAS